MNDITASSLVSLRVRVVTNHNFFRKWPEKGIVLRHKMSGKPVKYILPLLSFVETVNEQESHLYTTESVCNSVMHIQPLYRYAEK